MDDKKNSANSQIPGNTPTSHDDIPPPPAQAPISPGISYNADIETPAQTPSKEELRPETLEPTSVSTPASDAYISAPESTSVPPTSSNRTKIYGIIAAVILLVVAIPAGIFLTSRNQDFREKAAGGDPLHCGASDSTQRNQGLIVGNCTGWRETNNSCAADLENPYYYDSCTPATHPDGCARPDDTVQCLSSDQQKEMRNRGLNAACYTKTGNPAESVKISENRCPLYKHPDSCTGYGDTVQCLDETQKQEARNIGKNAVCYAGANPAESILISVNRCGAPYVPTTTTHPDGCARVSDTVQCLDETQKQEARNIGKNAVCYAGANPAESILISVNRCGAPYVPPTTAGANTTLCSTIELIKANSIVFESSPGNNQPVINTGENFQVRVMCTSTDPADNFDKIQVKITTPSGASTQEKAAVRFQERDRGASRAFFAIFDLTTSSSGNYNIKAWGHTPIKGWKGKE